LSGVDGFQQIGNTCGMGHTGIEPLVGKCSGADPTGTRAAIPARADSAAEMLHIKESSFAFYAAAVSRLLAFPDLANAQIPR